jgi:hypothetical protein
VNEGDDDNDDDDDEIIFSDLCQPHQVHVSLGSAATEMIVMWATKGPCDTVISYATHPWNLNSEYTGTHLELEPSLNNTYRFIHRVVLKVSLYMLCLSTLGKDMKYL